MCWYHETMTQTWAAMYARWAARRHSSGDSWKRRHIGSVCSRKWCFRQLTYEYRCGSHQFCDDNTGNKIYKFWCSRVHDHRGLHSNGIETWPDKLQKV